MTHTVVIELPGKRLVDVEVPQLAALEIARLQEVNAELLEALKGMIAIHEGKSAERMSPVGIARAAIAKAESGK